MNHTKIGVIMLLEHCSLGFAEVIAEKEQPLTHEETGALPDAITG